MTPLKKKKLSSKKDVHTTALAHEGTLEAIDRLKKVVETSRGEKRAMAELALEEARYFYSVPQNEAEEQDWILLSLLQGRQKEYDGLLVEADQIREGLQDLAVEEKVAEVLWQQAKKGEKEQKKMFRDTAADLVAMEQHQLEHCEQKLLELEEWMQAARSLIATEKYQTMPEDFASFFSSHEEEGEEGGFFCPCCESSDEEVSDRED
ncbi:MAG TPA: hypothetical protein VJB99_01035 [Patescibacteria group bacterium]|nr:hypothetical protein [Patescibacteria group bacterium]